MLVRAGENAMSWVSGNARMASTLRWQPCPHRAGGGAALFHWEGTFVDATPRCDLEVIAAELETLGFSADEAARLARFRAHARKHGEYAEHKAMERRLEFVLWLVEHGRLKH